MKLLTMTFGWLSQRNISLKGLECCAFTIGPWFGVTMPAVIVNISTCDLD